MDNQFQVVHIQNPFDPYKDMVREVKDWHPDLTVMSYLRDRYGNEFKYFDRPTLCQVNGVPKMYEEWETARIYPGQIVSLTALPGEVVTLIIYAVVAIVAALAVVLLMGDPTLPGNLASPESVYNYSGQKNRLRIGEPIEVVYGKKRVYPSYAASIYTQYYDNDQYNFSLYCVGQGRFEIHDILLEDTPLDDFEDAEYEVIPPNDEVTLFPDNVITSVEVGNIELYGPNEPEYTSWSGPFTINPPTTLCKRIEFDLTFPQGLYKNDEGKLKIIDVDVDLQYREIDDDGDPVGARTWTTVSKTWNLQTNTPQRFTIKVNPPTKGRFEVRARRTNNARLNVKFVEQLNWEACRAFLPSTKDYGDVTILAVKVRANNNVNNNTQQRVNLIVTRKLHMWNSTTHTWSALTPTRSIVWAFCDAFRNSEYGANLDGDYLDLDALAELDNEYTDRGENFDFIFDNPLTVWEVAKTIARVGRAVPMLVGSKITMIRDYPKLLSSAVFGSENIIKDSFMVQYKHFQPDETDSVIMTYIDPDTHVEEEVLCVMPGGTSINPERITFAGCSKRSHAYHEGMYILANRLLVKDTITFRTGLEGHIPTYGDRISVYNDIPMVGLGSGFVLELDGDVIHLSQPVEFSEGLPSVVEYAVIIRRKNGTAAGPFIVESGTGTTLTLTVAPDPDDYAFSNYNEPPIFLFGLNEQISLDCKVVEITPSDDETVEIVCTNYEPDIFLWDETAPPPLDDPDRPPRIPDRPVVDFITVSDSPLQNSYIIVGWSPALGATRYILQFSYDNVNWNIATKQTGTSFVLAVNPATVYLRVAGINVDRGPWKEWTGFVGLPKFVAGYPDNLATASPSSTSRQFTWNASAYATVYRIQIQSIGAAAPCRDEEIYDLKFTYTKAMYLADGGSHASFVFRVYGVNAKGSSQFNLTVVITSSPTWYP
jgi:hypothetical protein